MADTPPLLCSPAQFTSAAFADLASALTGDALVEFLQEATRLCEEECGRRLVPYTLTETHRAEGMDPDEYTDSANLPMDLQGTLGRSYAYALGASTLVRHVWLSNYAPMYPEYWTYSNVSLNIIRSYGGSQEFNTTQLLSGPDPDTGHVWFQLGTFLPIGSLIYATYTGGYTTIPASLVRACKFMTAYLIVRELQPEDTNHDPDQLHTDALMTLSNWQRP